MLNPRTIESAIRSAAGETLLIDGTGERGAGRLALRIRPGRGDAARAEWLVQWWRDGRRQYAVIGRYPTISLRQARDLFATEWRPEIEAGRDPRRTRELAAATGTVAQLFRGYVDAMKAQGLRSWPQVEAALITGRWSAQRALGANTLASEVTPEMVTAYLARAFNRGARSGADHYRAYLHAAFNWGASAAYDYTTRGVRRGGLERPAVAFGIKVNPVAIIPRDTEASQPRDRHLSAAELGRLWHDLDGAGFGLITAPAIRLLLCTGQRVQDVLRAEGADFDLAEALWVIPAAKRKRPELGDHVVPLTPEALEVARLLVAIRGSGLLFPHGRRADVPVPHQTVNRALVRWAEVHGIERVQARDLRRTWKTLAGEAGLSKEIRDRIQGHALRDVSSMHYDRYGYLREKREAMRVWGEWMAREIRRAAEISRRAA